MTFGTLSREGTGSAVDEALGSGFPGSGVRHVAGIVIQLHRFPGL